MPFAKARAAGLRPALDVRGLVMPGRVVAGRRRADALAHAARPLSAGIACALLACGDSSGSVATGGGVAARSGYEGMNFYEANGDEPPPIASAPLGAAPGSYEFVSGDDALPACSAGVGQRATAAPGDPALACPPIAREMISDFSFTGNPNSVTFSPDAAVPGGTFHYPDGPGGLVSDVTNGDWHLYGTVRSISGFGLYLSGCGQVDAAAYRGIAFTLWGEIGDGGALVLFVGSSENQVASSWINANEPSPAGADEPINLGRCLPLATRYDGTCREARRILNVPPAPEPSLILWRDLAEGCPEPSVNPSEVTSIAWYFPQPARGSYTVDIHIDDLRFTDEGPL